MCFLLEVTRSCYYRWLHVDHQDDDKLNELIKDVFIGSCKTYGTRRFKKQIEQLYGLIVSRRRIVSPVDFENQLLQNVKGA